MVLVGCSNSSEISGVDGSLGFSGDNKEDDELSFSEEERRRGENDDDDDDDDDDPEFVYPALQFQILDGSGSTATCREQGSDGTKKITATMDVTLSRKELKADLIAMRVHVGDDHQGEADGESNKSLGPTIYTRPSKEELDKTKKKNDDWFFTTTAVFANKIEKKTKGHVFEMDPPIPVFGFPANGARYRDLEKRKTWNSKVTSNVHGNFDVTITLIKILERGDEVTLELTTNIPQDQNWEIYEDFPVPVKGTYVINTKEKDVRRIDSLNQFLSSSKNCKGNRDTVNAKWTLCRKEKDGEVETFCN
jgi:hypothetical protein